MHEPPRRNPHQSLLLALVVWPMSQEQALAERWNLLPDPLSGIHYLLKVGKKLKQIVCCVRGVKNVASSKVTVSMRVGRRQKLRFEVVVYAFYLYLLKQSTPHYPLALKYFSFCFTSIEMWIKNELFTVFIFDL
jgi:hypothetical protein